MSKLTIDDLTVERLLGEGNMSRVFEARIDATGEPVALKLVDKSRMNKLGKRLEVLMEKHCLILLNPHSYRDHETTRAFPAAVQATATERVTAPHHGTQHVCQLFHTFTTDLEVALVMELCEGQELWDAIKCLGICDQQKLVECWTQIEQALQAMHERSIIHRDVKAENIVIKRNGQLKFADFGTAYDLTLPFETTVAGTRTRGDRLRDPQKIPALHFYVGTPNFMGPESRRNKIVKDTRIDIWSLGCLHYQLITGAPPFQAPSEFLIYLRAQNHDLDVPCYMPPAHLAYIKECLRDRVCDRPSWQRLAEISFTGEAACCTTLTSDIGDATPIQKVLRRRVPFYANLIIDFIKEKHASDFAANAPDSARVPRTAPTPAGEDESSPANGPSDATESGGRLDGGGCSIDSRSDEDVACWKQRVLPYENVPVAPLLATDCCWLRQLYPWLEGESASCLLEGESCRKGKLLIDAYALTPSSPLWKECWTRLANALRPDSSNAADVALCQQLAAANTSTAVTALIISSRMCAQSLDSFVRCAFHALRELCTRDRSDDLYENWAKLWTPLELP